MSQLKYRNFLIHPGDLIAFNYRAMQLRNKYREKKNEYENDRTLCRSFDRYLWMVDLKKRF